MNKKALCSLPRWHPTKVFSRWGKTEWSPVYTDCSKWVGSLYHQILQWHLRFHRCCLACLRLLLPFYLVGICLSRMLHCRVFLLIFLLVEDTMKIILRNRTNPMIASSCLLVFNLQFFRSGG